MKIKIPKISQGLKFVFRKLFGAYNFNQSNPLGGNGERVDLLYNGKVIYRKMDMYQKNHFKRYEFAKSIIAKGTICGDFACGTGYGSAFLADKAKHVTGIDLDQNVIETIKYRYRHLTNVNFLHKNLLSIEYVNHFDVIVSFETIEHFKENDISSLLGLYSRALKNGGIIILSTPYMQEESKAAKDLGFHLTFNINEEKIKDWLKPFGLKVSSFWYQNYSTHEILEHLDTKDFIICVCTKSNL